MKRLLRNAGDGTSTATLLADAIVREGVRYVTAGNDPLALRRGIQKAADVASDELLKAATQVTTREQMAEIATVSSGDPEIGAKIAEALDEIGQDGVISVEKSTKFGIDLEVKKGMLFDRGFISPYMADDMGSMTGELEQIIAYMDTLNALDTSGVEPLSHVFPVKNVLREDEVQPSMDRGMLLKNAPAADDEAFLVPKTVE